MTQELNNPKTPHGETTNPQFAIPARPVRRAQSANPPKKRNCPFRNSSCILYGLFSSPSGFGQYFLFNHVFNDHLAIFVSELIGRSRIERTAFGVVK